MEDYYIISEKDYDANFIEVLGIKKEQCIVINKKEFMDSIIDKNIDNLFNVDFNRCNIYLNGQKCENMSELSNIINAKYNNDIKALFTQRVYFLAYKLYYQKINCDKKIYHIGELLNGNLNFRRIHNYLSPDNGYFETSKILQVFHFEEDEQIFDYLLKITISVDIFYSDYVIINYEII